MNYITLWAVWWTATDHQWSADRSLINTGLERCGYINLIDSTHLVAPPKKGLPRYFTDFRYVSAGFDVGFEQFTNMHVTSGYPIHVTNKEYFLHGILNVACRKFLAKWIIPHVHESPLCPTRFVVPRWYVLSEEMYVYKLQVTVRYCQRDILLMGGFHGLHKVLKLLLLCDNGVIIPNGQCVIFSATPIQCCSSTLAHTHK
jgi:hypothetical protein